MSARPAFKIMLRLPMNDRKRCSSSYFRKAQAKCTTSEVINDITASTNSGLVRHHLQRAIIATPLEAAADSGDV